MPVHNSFICLQRCCRTALEKLYPAGVPPTAMWRYHREMRLLERAKKSVIDEFLLFKELSDAAQKLFSKIYVPSPVQGTMLIYLLGDHDLNPLPAHYYCTACGYYTEPRGVAVGLDLPPANCPHCGRLLRRDGFSLRRQWSERRVEEGIPAYWFPMAFIPPVAGSSNSTTANRADVQCPPPAGRTPMTGMSPMGWWCCPGAKRWTPCRRR